MSDGPDSLFPETPWSLIARGVGGENEEQKEALRQLLSAYWRPIFCCIRYGWQKDEQEAKDLCESFLSRLVHDPELGELSQGYARFRDFLKQKLKAFMQDPRPGKKTSGVAFEGAITEEYEQRNPEEVFDQDWMLVIIEKTIQKLKLGLGETHRPHFEIFKVFDIEGHRPDPSELAKTLEIEQSQVLPMLFDARRRFRRYVIEEIHEYATDHDDAVEELAWLLG